ncbi:tRNA-splicing endonuclease subunit [Lobosporangium transversale]|uniref:tRNA-splicing endonuclease subunit Sen34 n=1 Tax=Lobosporangium transversale TaxID=64571 RepID=A0A1Y2GZU4_9FUNG|nr:hypothetical protein BCR41DRAFT_418828 [Lobosporangium transversale]KAF9910978.1 tRNA-splicing endonuclease subunit [Lobosporangium transversale]ORZ27830.1 hypothetical protein BCR41DRAFT_418828 [Lobosporangium transversale]|eukprot:XP_021885533.1 hypothetical protein BCR41DRAFT_418828 [Lobosporangium transversale]
MAATINPYSSKPRIHLVGSEALVWDIQDVRKLRQTYRIVGSLTGSLARSPMQNIFQGLPLRLLPEEVYVLRSRDLVDLVDENRSYNVSDSAPRPDGFQASNLIAPAANNLMSATRSTSSDNSRNNNNNNASECAHLYLHTLSDCLPYYKPISPTEMSVSWTYPNTTRQQQKVAIFMHLWETHKFFLAPGMKFGGDYLLYKNDPLVCHADLIASVVQCSNQSLPLVDLATHARLATTVQKQHLICCCPSTTADTTTNVGKIYEPHEYEKAKETSTINSSPELWPHVSPPALPVPNKGHIMMFVVEWAGF